MNTTATATPLAPAGAGDLSTSLKKLFESMLAASRGAAQVAIEAVRAMWRWIAALMERIARALGMRSKAPEQLTDEQARGEQPTQVSALAGDGAGSASAETASAAMRGEAARLMDHLSESVDNPKALTDPQVAMEFVKFQAHRLGEYREAFLEHARELEVQIDALCAEIAAGLGTTAGVVRAQIEAGADGGLYDKEGHVAKLIQQQRQARLSAGRVELAAISLLDACSRPDAPPGLRDYAREALSSSMPGVDFDRPAAPAGDVAAAAGDGPALPDDVDMISVGDPVAGEGGVSVAEQPSGALRADSTKSHAQDVLSTKTSLESPVKGMTGIRLVSSDGASVLEDDVPGEVSGEAFRSPFASKGAFSKLIDQSRKRQEESPQAWRDQADR